MELRAREDTGMAQDLTPPLPPLAIALHDSFLRSHCTSCFQTLSQRGTPLPCNACNASVLYCSPRCCASDSALHASSTECLFLRLLPQSPPDTADLRAALRLLRAFEGLGLLQDFNETPRRVGGLLASGLEEVLEEGGETAERIREGAALMSQARNAGGGGGGGGEERGGRFAVEEVVLWAVLTNAVEVQIGDESALGIAVYGPHFTWFNHSCSPNACYRFELASQTEAACSCDLGSLRVLPAGAEEGTSVQKAWSCGDGKLRHGFCIYGPTIVVRSIKPIKKGDEVCITYTDLLQPKAVRQFDLWSKYRFVCCCDRCSASPQKYTDYILNCNAALSRLRILNSDNSYMDAEFTKVSDFIDQSIEDFMLDGNPEACCKKLEKLLSKSFHDEKFQAEQTSQRKLKLQPLHHLSFKAYLTLVSAYRIRASNLEAMGLREENILETLKMRRAAAAYSLLLAGATNYLFLSEPSLIASTTLYWISAGESILDVVRTPMWRSKNEMRKSYFRLASDYSQCTVRDGFSMSCMEFKAAALRFLECASRSLSKSWPFLALGFPYLENIKSPVDFRWLELANGLPQIVSGRKGATECEGPECSGYQYTAEPNAEEEMGGLFLLAVQCLTYGRDLASICYGPDCYLADHARDLLCSS